MCSRWTQQWSEFKRKLTVSGIAKDDRKFISLNTSFVKKGFGVFILVLLGT